MSRFTILRLLGRGGTGTVYEAIRESGGASRRVALKLLGGSPDPRTLSRFRDEARILSLVRDRAVVWADAPIALSAGYAVVMDLAPGADVASILEQTGPADPASAAEIVGEVARALHNLWAAAGPDGPLRLVHRDLKPSNLQISSSGEVRVLDFGNARASFSAREAHTTRHIGGTPGYIAPERLSGIEGPEGDIWSLGQVLRELISPRSGQSAQATARTLPASEIPALAAAPGREIPAEIPEPLRALIAAMTDPAPERRPTAQQVARRCRELARELPGEGLPDWAERAVPASRRELPPDTLVGTVLTTIG